MKCVRLLGLVTLILTSARLSAAPPVYSVIDVGSLGGNITQAYGINDNGDIVGEAKLSNSSSSASHAFLYRHASRPIVDLGAPGGTASLAFSSAGPRILGDRMVKHGSEGSIVLDRA
jgi:probable HAF family extracellular repeat protein